MNTPINKETIIFSMSHNDLDGYSSSYFINHFFQNNLIHFYNINYTDEKETINKIFSKILENRKLSYLFIISDIGLTEDTIIKLKNFLKGNKDIDLKIQVLDHHIPKTSIEEYDWYLLDKTMCAAKITYYWCIKNNPYSRKDTPYLDTLAHLVDATDMWRTESPYFYRGNFLSDCVFNVINYPKLFLEEKREHIFFFIDLYSKEIFNKKTIGYIEDNLYTINRSYLKNKIPMEIYQEDMTYNHKLYYYFYLLFKKYKNEFRIFTLNGYNFILVHQLGSSPFQYVSHHYLQNNDDNIDFIIHTNGDKKFSLRSEGDVNVSEIASLYFDGGGHKNASGGFVSELGDLKDQKDAENKLIDYFRNNFSIAIKKSEI